MGLQRGGPPPSFSFVQGWLSTTLNGQSHESYLIVPKPSSRISTTLVNSLLTLSSFSAGGKRGSKSHASPAESSRRPPLPPPVLPEAPNIRTCAISE